MRLRIREWCCSLLTGFAISAAACADPAGIEQSEATFAKGSGAGPSVQSADPPFGHQGDAGLAVLITGSGFDQNSVASWERNGTPDPKITVHSTRFISSSQLETTISIAGDADLAFYDIAITTGRGRKGIGTEMFEVTQAIALEGSLLIRGVNERGGMTGQSSSGSFFWSPSTGMQMLRSGGSGWDISEDGLTIVGGDGAGTAMVSTRTGDSWLDAALPTDPTAQASYATALTSDPATGAATAIAGAEDLPAPKRNPARREPRLWLRNGTTIWQRVTLPGSAGATFAFVNDLSENLIAVGYLNNAPAVWEPDGTGGWALSVIGPANSGSGARNEVKAINRTGTLIAGYIEGAGAVMWQRSGAGWGSPQTLPGQCGGGVGIDDLNRIIMRGCRTSTSSTVSGRVTSAVVQPPYTSLDLMMLGGLGNLADGPQAWAISRNGTWIVGSSTLKNTVIGAYWNFF